MPVRPVVIDMEPAGGFRRDYQYTCSDWRRFLEDHDLEVSMSRRGNCQENTVAESLFPLL
ncbi:MAG: hypothetical protein KDC54_04845 [Lewinella sp.]|nr:hypothetical protein [Lewinella sp.]